MEKLKRKQQSNNERWRHGKKGNEKKNIYMYRKMEKCVKKVAEVEE